MSSGVGQVIEANDYVSIKTLINPILGIGSEQSGYGQNIVSTNSSTGETIPHTKWVELRGDMVRCRQHQKGVSIGSTEATDGFNLAIPDSGTAVTETIRNQYALFAAQVVADKFLVADNQIINETLISSQRTTKWNGTVTHTITVTGSTSGNGSAENLRYFFNAGGRLRFSASRTGGSSRDKNTNWTTLLTDMGEIIFDYTHTVSTRTGSGSSLGWFGLTTSDQLIFQKDGTGVYSSNSYKILARKSNDGTSIIFSVLFVDAYSTIPDFNVDGTLTSQLTQDRPNTTNVTIYTNMAVDSGLTTTGPALSQYNITPSLTSIDEGVTVTFTVYAESVADGTTLYWTTVGEVTSTRFSDNLTQGTVVINGNTGIITRTVVNDFVTDGPTYFALQLRVDGYTGTVMNTSDSVLVKDTSIETYEITPNVLSIYETETVVFTINTRGVPNGTILFWTLTGTVSGSDFVDGAASGSFVINNNVGTINRTALGDMVIEQTEMMSLQIRTASINGPIIATSAPIFIKDATFSMTANKVNVNEGETVTFSITTQGVANGSTLYWNTLGSAAKSFRFSDNNTQGTIIVNGNTASLERTLANDHVTDGSTQFSIEVRTGSQSGKVVATSGNITVNDTSVEVYNITPDKTALTPTGTVVFSISTLGLLNGTTLYWTTYGSITNKARFSDNVNSGSIVINNNTASLTRTLVKDPVADNSGNFAIQVRTLSITGTVMTMSSSVTVANSTYEIIPNSTNVNEGDTVTFSVNTTGVDDGTILYWSTIGSGSGGTSRFTDNTFTGQVTITGNHGTITRTITNNFTIDGPSYFALQLRITATNGTVVATSNNVTVNDTSIPTCTITPDITSVGEGQTVTFIIKTQGINDGTTLYLKCIGSVLSNDFTDGKLSGSIVINNNQVAFTRTIANDNQNEGVEHFQIAVYKDSAYTTLFGNPSAMVYIRPSGNYIWKTPGSYSWVVPEEVTTVSYTVVAGGGSGGSAQETGNGGGGGGGGSGGYITGSAVVTPGETITITVGAGGEPSTASGRGGTSSGKDGGYSSISGSVGTATVTGGKAGSGSNGNSGGAGGAGGTPNGAAGVAGNSGINDSDSPKGGAGGSGYQGYGSGSNGADAHDRTSPLCWNSAAGGNGVVIITY